MVGLWDKYGWALIVAGLIAAWTIQAVVNVRRRRAVNHRLVAISEFCGRRGMSQVDDNATMFVPEMIGMPSAVYSNSFATPDWTLWFSEIRDRQDRNAQERANGYGVLLFTADGMNIPYVAVARKGVVNMPAYVGGTRQSVGLESIDFNDRFRIQADDPRAAVMLVDLAMMQWLMDLDQVSFQISGPLVRAIVKASPKIEGVPAELDLLFRFRDGFAAHVPQMTFNEYPAQPGMAAAILQAMRMSPDMLSSLLRGATIRQT